MDVIAQLQAIVAEVAETDDPSQIASDANLYTDLGLDSMMALELVLMIEEAFAIVIDEETLGYLQTFGDITKEIQGRLRKAG